MYKMVTDTIPFQGKDLSELVIKIMKGKYTVPHYITIQLQILSKLITVDPTERSTLLQIMPDLWLNIGHKEDLTPSNDLNSGVTQPMVSMGFKQDQILSA